ncbi:MAG: hypothetical protein AAB595_00515 [Patescibacteria group bacterium]|mgnify:CR=1 FL=1
MKNNIESGQLEKKISSKELKELRAMRWLENFRHLEPKDKVFLVLVWRKLKGASAISLEGGVPTKILNELKTKIQEAGMLFKEGGLIDEETQGLRKGKVCLVANNKEDLNLISNLWSGDHVQREEAEKDLFSEDEKRALLQLEPDLIPFSFLLPMSRENLESELKVVHKWVKEIRLFPIIYQLFLNDFRLKEQKAIQKEKI